MNGQWVTVPVVDAATGQTVSTNTNPHENNDEGNGITGTSGGAYFVDEPEYVTLQRDAAGGRDGRPLPLLDGRGLPRRRVVHLQRPRRHHDGDARRRPTGR